MIYFSSLLGACITARDQEGLVKLLLNIFFSLDIYIWLNPTAIDEVGNYYTLLFAHCEKASSTASQQRYAEN